MDVVKAFGMLLLFVVGVVVFPAFVGAVVAGGAWGHFAASLVAVLVAFTINMLVESWSRP